jgi:soluble lytic murein transglycosylase-like protein
MKSVRMAVLSAALVAGSVLAVPFASTTAEAAVFLNGVRMPVSSSNKKVVRKVVTRKDTVRKVATRKAVRSNRVASRKVRGNGGVPAGRGHVVAMIKSMAPSYGVPTWFALRIAHVESGYNPRARGAAGEIGVYQMKCQTARGLGYRGNCAGLYNARTNIQVGLKHLSQAVRLSRGNLRLAASKHNGGLGRKSLVRKYVNRVF